MEQTERWRKLCQKITKDYEPGRETQRIGIRGVRIVRHKAAIGMNEIQMFLKCTEVWRTIKDKRIILKYKNMLIGLFLNGHRRGRGEICPHNFILSSQVTLYGRRRDFEGNFIFPDPNKKRRGVFYRDKKGGIWVWLAKRPQWGRERWPQRRNFSPAAMVT